MTTTVIRPVKASALVAVAAGVVLVSAAAFLTHGVIVASALFPEAEAVPSVTDATPSPRYAAAVARAREVVRAAISQQNLPGVSVAVGAGVPAGALAAGGGVIWAEGFGWRDVGSRTPVTPRTRFHIGTAASAVAPAVEPLGLASTGAEPAAAWSPEHVGEPEEDAPPLTFLRHVVFQPLGLMPAEYPLPDDRATFYVPRSDDDPARGRRLMYMRDLACCADGKAFYSTPSDLVRVGLATKPGTVNGELAGGMVMSLAGGRDGGIVVAVTSNIAHADTSTLAQRVVDAFGQKP